VPRTTAVSWIRRGPRPVVTAAAVAGDTDQLRVQVLRLDRRLQGLLAIVRLHFGLARVAGIRLSGQRLPSGEAKRTLLGALARATRILRLPVTLRVVGLSPSRYHTWCRLEQTYCLDARSSCRHCSPAQLTADEVATMHQMVTAEAYRHLSCRRARRRPIPCGTGARRCAMSWTHVEPGRRFRWCRD
jgi:hypothetical protein